MPLATPTVVVWPDTFTDAFRPSLGRDLVSILERLGDTVVVPTDWACCGRPLYDMGMLRLARKSLGTLLDVLSPWIELNIPVVVSEPSCLAAFRDELPALLPHDPRAAALAGLARSPAEHLLTLGTLVDVLAVSAPVDQPPVLVHPHCHARASGAATADQRLLELLGWTATTLDAGCCGLAGSFGFRREHEALSRRIGETSWLPKLRQSVGDATLVVDGFSCATQLEHLDGPAATTVVALLNQRLAPK